MTAAQSLMLALALVVANLPFATRRILLLGPVPGAGKDKSLLWRLVELLLGYILLGLLAATFETSAYGAVYSQGWQFFAVTVCLFLVFAYPGFVLRHLWHRRKG